MSSEETQVRASIGGLPPFWDRSVAFVANLLGLFFGNEEEVAKLSQEVGDVDSYGGRLIPILDILFTSRNNVLLLERRPDESLCGYFRQLGLSLPELEILSHREYTELGHRLGSADESSIEVILERLSQHGAGWMDGYVTDSVLERIATRLGKQTITTAAGSYQGNNKWLLFEHVRDRGLPHVATEVAAGVDQIPECLELLAARGFRSAVVKAQIGASGIGLIKVPAIDSGDPLPEIGNHFFYEGAAMVQGWLEPGVLGVARIFSPSVQMFLDDSSVHLFDVTEQILSSDSIHEGNESPAPLLKTRPEVGDELLRQASVAGEWLHSVGYRGTASTDFLVVERDDGELEAYVCEINARVTGATYPAVLARHFRPQSAWLLRNIRLHESLAGDRMLELLDNSKQLYERGDAAGLLPINFNLGRDELVFKGQFLCLAETLDECHQILGDTASVLPIAWEYERD